MTRKKSRSSKKARTSRHPKATVIKQDNPVAKAISEAEEVRDPLEGLVERSIDDPGAPFKPETMEAIVALKKSDRAAFETLRKNLKDAGCRMVGFEEALREAGGGVAREPTQSDILIALAQQADIFHDPNQKAYADITIDGHRETWAIDSKGFKDWLRFQFFQEEGGAPGSEAMTSAIGAIAAEASFNAEERTVCLRVGRLGDKLYLDLGDAAWRCVEIGINGWRIMDQPPIRFRRSSGLKPLPAPEKGGSINDLRPFLNVQSEDDFVLIIGWILTALTETRTYPLLIVSGEQGSATSTFVSLLRDLIDPNAAPLRALPREAHELFIAANNGHLLAFDNVSGLSGWISDTLCRLATGGGFAVRQLYTDQDEVLFEAARPAILNGIEDMVGRPDLADRSIFLNLAAIPDEARRPAAELRDAFAAKQPYILGALLDGLVKGLNMRPKTQLETLPRMADFALWSSACETAYWPAGTFMKAYGANRADASESLLDGDPVAFALRVLMRGRTERTQTSSDLLAELKNITDAQKIKTKDFPGNARAMAAYLRRIIPPLRKTGIEIKFLRAGKKRTRLIEITNTSLSSPPDKEGDFASASSAAAASVAAGDPISSSPDELGRRTAASGAEPASPSYRGNLAGLLEPDQDE
jgi:hypothetical protein